MTLTELNQEGLGGFVAALGWIFEGSPWVAELAWEKRPFATLGALHRTMTAVVAAASEEQQVALLRAHPDLGTRAKISDASGREQAGAGLDTLTRDEFERVQHLNAAYRERFGFPFLYAVKGSTKADVIGALERRLTSTRDIEHQEALRQVFRIARFRLEDTVEP